MKGLIEQIMKFAVVGVIAAIIDIGLLALLNDIFHIDTLVASALSFTASVIVNYILSMKFVFKSKGNSKSREFVIFTLLSVGGLGINQLIMWAGIEYTNIHYMIVKIFAMVFVPIYNFITRKLILEKRG